MVTAPVSEMTIRLTTPDDMHLPYYSHSIMEAIVTCPKWGLIRYRDRKYFKSRYRATALEAGSAMHEVFAALRLWQLRRRQHLPDHFAYHANRIFGIDRATACFWPKPDERDEALNFCFEILNSGDWYDDPTDKIRTLANMEETTIKYVHEQLQVMDRSRIWVEDIKDPTKRVGIEITFDIVVDEIIRYIGTIDGVVVRPDDHLRLEENKTANRIDEAYRESFRVKFQPTGYTVASRLLFDHPITENKILAIKVKQTRSVEDFVTFIEHRTPGRQFEDFHRTLLYTHQLAMLYGPDPLNAPMFTHSCNRYFRPCGFVDLCQASTEDQQMMYDAMETTPFSPSERAIHGRAI